MNKTLKRSYECLDLGYDATEQQIRFREKALIRFYNTKAQEKGLLFDKQINEVKMCANMIIDNIKTNGMPNETKHEFKSSWKSIAILAGVLLTVVMICAVSFYSFL